MNVAELCHLIDSTPPMREPEGGTALAALSRFAITQAKVLEMEETEIRCGGLIAIGHLMALVAAANAGKTQIAKYIIARLCAEGFTGYYFQEDASAGDLPREFDHAQRHGYTLLNSTLAGASANDMLDVLEEMATSGTDLKHVILVLDTLKKFQDVMSKGGARRFFTLMRSLTQRGATIIVLGHTNKHLGLDGKPVFEGVGDIRNDVDELIYLDSTEKDPHGIKTLTYRPDKTRCDIKPATFTLDTNTMILRSLDRVIDVQELERNRRQQQDDAQVIQAIDEVLAGGGVNRSELIERAATVSGIGERTVRKVLDRYTSENKNEQNALWMLTHLRLNNARHISLNPARNLPCLNGRTVKTAEPAQPSEPSEPDQHSEVL